MKESETCVVDLSRFLQQPHGTRQGGLREGDRPVGACAVIAQSNRAISRPMLFGSFQGMSLMSITWVVSQDNFLSKSRNLTQMHLLGQNYSDLVLNINPHRSKTNV